MNRKTRLFLALLCAAAASGLLLLFLGHPLDSGGGTGHLVADFTWNTSLAPTVGVQCSNLSIEKPAALTVTLRSRALGVIGKEQKTLPAAASIYLPLEELAPSLGVLP